MSKASVLIVGLGQRTVKKAVPVLCNLSDQVQIVGCVEPYPPKELPEALKDVPIYSNMEEAIKAGVTAQFAYVAVPHSAYDAILKDTFAAGINTLKEKPLSTTAVEGQKIIDLAEKAGVLLGVAAQRRFSKRYLRVKEWLPIIGQVTAVHASEKIVVKDLAEGWRASKSASGGGVVLDMGYHMLDQLVGLFGGEFEHVTAKLLKTRDGDYDVEDTAHIHITFSGGTQTNVILSRAGSEQEELLEIIGQYGVLKLTEDKVTLTATGGSDIQSEVFSCEESSTDMLKNLLSSFLKQDVMEWNIRRDLAVMRLIDEIYAEGKIESTILSRNDSKRSPVIKKWSWPRITNEVESIVKKQLHTTLSIYNNGGVFGEFEQDFKTFLSSADSDLNVLLHNSGTNALHATFYSVGLGPGDEVIVPVYTFHATVSPLMQLGVVPVFVDANASTGNIDPDGVRAAITSKTKAVIVTHMWGVPCDMEKLVRICKDANILLLEDCAHAHGATVNGKVVGTFGDGAAWSIQGEKVITGGEGGVSVTPHKEAYYRQLIHGHYNKRCTTEIPKDHPLRAFVLTGSGLKNRAHPIAVAVALHQLRSMPNIHKWKSHFAAKVVDALRNVPFLKPQELAPGAESSYYALVLLFDKEKVPNGLTRERYVEELVDRGLPDVDIPGSTKPLHKEALYLRPWEVLPHLYKQDDYTPRWTENGFPGADAFYSSAIKIPVWAYEDDVETMDEYAKIMREVAEEFMNYPVN